MPIQLDSSAVAFLTAIVAALLSFILTYLNNLRLNKRKERLELVNKRINQFYGPLYVTVSSSEIAYKAYLKKVNEQRAYKSPAEFSEYEIEEWKIWLESVLMPLNLYGEKVILENAYLVREEEVPQCLLDFLTHVSAYKAVLKKWESGNRSEYMPLIDFPTDLNRYVSTAYHELKTEQLKLIGNQKKRTT